MGGNEVVAADIQMNEGRHAMTHRGKAFRLGLVLSLMGAIALAQKPNPKDENSTRTVEGVVQDAGKQPTAGAVVQLKDTKTLQIRSFITQADGRFHFTGLSTNVDYELRAEKAGQHSGTKRVDIFNTHPVININLQLK